MNAPAGRPWRVTANGVALDVRLTPKGGSDRIDGIATLADGRAVVKARVRAAPEDGKANAALVALVAAALGVPPRDVAVVAGAASRTKRVMIAGDGPMLMAALEKLLATTR